MSNLKISLPNLDFLHARFENFRASRDQLRAAKAASEKSSAWVALFMMWVAALNVSEKIC